MGNVGNGSPSTTDRKLPRRPAWLVPVGLAIAIALYNLLLCPLHGGGDPDDWGTVLFMGVVFVQPLLSAVWATLGPGSLVYRLPLSAATLVAWIFAQSTPKWNVLATESARTKLNIEMAATFFVAFSIASAILGVVRRVSDIHISQRDSLSPPSPTARHQFGVRYLLGWMTVCAVLIVIGRSFVADSVQLNQPWLSLIWELSIVIMFVLLLMTPPVVLPLMALMRPMPWRWMLLVVATGPVFVFAAVKTVELISGPGRPPDAYGIFAGVQVGATLAALACATVLRAGGFHLTSAVYKHDTNFAAN